MDVGAFEIALASMPTLRPQQQGAIEIDWSQLIGSAGTAAAKRTKGGEVQLSKGTILVGGCAFVFAALALPSVAAFLSRLACASAALTRLGSCSVFTRQCHCYVITACCCPRRFRCTHTCTPFLPRRKQSSRRQRVGVPGTTHTGGDNSSRDIKVLLKLEHHEVCSVMSCFSFLVWVIAWVEGVQVCQDPIMCAGGARLREAGVL